MAKIKIFDKNFFKNMSDSLKRPAVKKSMPAFFLFLASIMIIWLSMDNFNLNSELLVKNASLIESNNRFLALSASYEKILEDLAELSKDYSSLEGNYSLMNEKFFELNDSFNDFENMLEFQLDFFKVNGNIADIFEYSSIRRDLGKCYKHLSGDSYEINLACISYVLSNDAGLSYKNDSKNELLGLADFYNNGGGDCEDWAMAFTASFNYIKSLIPQGSGILLKSYHYSCEGFSKFFLTNDNNWYLNACPISFADYSNAQSFCGARDSDDFGHCWVIFTKEVINSSESINEAITSSAIVEPQNGAYEFSYTQALMAGYEFYVIITDKDLLMKLDYSWKGYTDYYNELIEKEKSVQYLIAKI